MTESLNAESTSTIPPRGFTAKSWFALIVFEIALVFAAVAAGAQVEDLVVWQPEPNGPRYVIPRIRGETPAQTASRWQNTVRNSETYRGMQGTQTLNLHADPSRFASLPRSSSERPNVAVVLNRPNQMANPGAYLARAMGSFEMEGPRLFAIPVGMTEVLRPEEMNQYLRLLNRMDGQLGVGGDDPHPHLYSNPIDPRTRGLVAQTTGDISMARDQEQMRYIREYIQNGHGRTFQICGSMQRCAIEDGRGFLPEIHGPGRLTQTPQFLPTGTVMREIVIEPNSELARAAGTTRMMTTNYHHAGVNGREVLPGRTPVTRITAWNVEGDRQGAVVKAIEHPGNAGPQPSFTRSSEAPRPRSISFVTSPKAGG